jgi:hypothetical protein
VFSCLRFGFWLVALGTSFVVSTWAQSSNSLSASGYQFLVPITTISKEVNEVNLAFTVIDHQGRFISNLRPEDFHFFDNQLTPPHFTFFQQRSDLPLHLAVLIAAGASVTHRFPSKRVLGQTAARVTTQAHPLKR